MTQQPPKPPGHMRSAMPRVAAIVDELRAAFGAQSIDPSIRAGVRGQAECFFAREAGHELGTPWRPEHQEGNP